ncbi:cobyric acid synthase [Aureimonas jatrophae]|uniref:Cobyric acid synthase n=1 Tax=Aureimonas jatrophae TaxID=1166073 RepID=A0A1H0D832_9HYPH|nr:cobyric acid synthase [Aureimonas jatrophae]MBB3951745.1 adenosylcobyric acid synthase [Aureimonas jatrophae]SDN66136.1 adenosylcobyric acid synthase (glutamine-hydrolysing) [Aureimonas jatrophae]
MSRPTALMLQGTGSDVGKSVLVAGLCRLFARRGLGVRPFKPQNMSNNAAVARIPGSAESGEIGRAQALQALACGVPASVLMNPVLLKPQGETGAQLVVRGRVRGTFSARDYQGMKAGLLAEVLDSYRALAGEADLVICEGAGSPAEINLRSGDIANMGFARAAEMPVVLVGDIDRGGVIASLVGTHTVLPAEDRAPVQGFLVNKFRGDPALFADGMAAVTRFTGWPALGLIPWLPEAALLPPEDSVSLERRIEGSGGALLVAVPRLPRIANFDDLDPLSAHPAIRVRFMRPGERLPPEAALVVLPGSKATASDLTELRRQGWDRDILAHHARGGRVLGLCGGYQMLGRTIHDPHGIEGPTGETVPGLGLLAVDTELRPEKTLREVEGAVGGHTVEAYEIHMGESAGPDAARPFAQVAGRAEGARSADGRVAGTYLHGVLAGSGAAEAVLASLGLVVSPAPTGYREGVERALDRIADRLEAAVDADALLRIARRVGG